MENPESSAQERAVVSSLLLLCLLLSEVFAFFSVRSKPYVPNLSLLKTPQICAQRRLTKIRYLTLVDEDDEAVREKGSSTVERKT